MAVKRIPKARLSLVMDLLGGSVDRWSELSTAKLVCVTDSMGMYDSKLQHHVESWTLELTGIQSLQPNSFWRIAWENPGKEIPFKLAPMGNLVPSETEPHFIGNLQLGPRPSLGGEAAVYGSQEFSAVLVITKGPEMILAPTLI